VKTAPVDWSTVNAILYGARLHRKRYLLRCETQTHDKSCTCQKHVGHVSWPLTDGLPAGPLPLRSQFFQRCRLTDRLRVALLDSRELYPGDSVAGADHWTANEPVSVRGAPSKGGTCTCWNACMMQSPTGVPTNA
jgi:hypothetical protein